MDIRNKRLKFSRNSWEQNIEPMKKFIPDHPRQEYETSRNIWFYLHFSIINEDRNTFMQILSWLPNINNWMRITWLPI